MTMLHETIRDRLRAEIARSGISAVEVARNSGVKTSFIYDILNGKSTNPSIVKLSQVAKTLGVELAYLAGDNAPSYKGAGSMVEVPLLKAAGGAQPGLMTDPAHTYHFRSSWVQGRLKATPQTLRVVKVAGDGMAPTLLEGDIVLIHTAERAPSPTGIFVLFDGTGPVVKRLEAVSGKLRILSDNPRYSAYERPLADIEVLGRVVWFGREL